MKHLTILFLIPLSIVLCFNSAKAQTPVNVCRAELFITDKRAQGKLATVGNTLVFVDEQYTDASFSIDRNNFTSLKEQDGVFSIYTRRPVRYRSVEERHFAFRFLYGNCDSMVWWLRGRSLTSQTQQARRLPLKPIKTFRAGLRRNMSRDTSGTLNIWMGRMIEFIPQSYDKRSRRWDLREIRDIEREGNNVLKVISSDGNKHTFDLRGKGMSADEFNMIRLQIGRRRIGR